MKRVCLNIFQQYLKNVMRKLCKNSQEKTFNRFKILINSLIIIKYRCMISNVSKDKTFYDMIHILNKSIRF